MKKLLLMDGNNVMFRAYYATAAMGNLMRNKNGFPTNMVYGFINIYTKFIKDGYTHIVVAFDKGSNTRRHKAYKDYKAGRAEVDEELFMQIPYIHKFLEANNVHYFLSDEFEADDIISTMHKKYYDEFDEIDVLSNDNDLFQLISDHSFQLYSKQKETVKYSIESLYQDKGIYPRQIPDYKGLIGDNSDNLKGVDGIGPKTAAKLLSEFDTLENIYDHINDIKGKNQEKLLKDKETAFFTKKMATLAPEFEFSESLDDFKVIEPNYELLKDLYTELDFQSLLKKIPRDKIKIDFNYKIIDNPFEIDRILKTDEIEYLYLENLRENYHISEKIGFGLSNSLGNFYIPYDVALSSFSFTMFLSDKNSLKVVHDYKKMYVSLLYDSITLDGIVFDTLLSSYLINPDLTKEDFTSISVFYGYTDILSDEEVYGKKDKEILPLIDIYAMHIAKKAMALSIIKEVELKELEENDQMSLLTDVEIPFSKVLGDMEYTGLRVDTDALMNYENDLLDELDELEKTIYSYAGHSFNISSPKQLGVVLFDELGLYCVKKTKTGYSTDQETLNYIKNDHPIINQILRYRMLYKLETTYVIGVKDAIKIKGDNHIHTIYKQALTDTGRLSSTEPNLQNLPIRNKEAREFRKIFIPEDNSYLLSSDYSQIELRVLASMSNDERLKEAFINGEDIHEATAKAILKKNEVTKEERSKAKAVNFGIIYGISPWGLSNDIGISMSEAKEFIDLYHNTFKDILPFSNSLIEFAEKNGYVKTLFNRRRYIRDIGASNHNIREFAKRTAMNSPIQGTAADILKIAMIKLDDALRKNYLHSKLVLTIHDEVVLNVLKDEIDQTKKITEDVLQGAVMLNVPLKVETEYGDTLYEAK